MTATIVLDGNRASPSIRLPLEVVTEKIGILASSGAGKSNLAAVMVEEMHAAGLHFVVIDPVGAWFGLRAGKDGNAKGGLEGVIIFGGKRGDVPIARDHGDVIADAVVRDALSCVVDLTDFEDDDDRTVFLTAFARRLYHTNERPLHLVLEEADQICPEMPQKGEKDLVRAWTNIVRRGRARGIGCTLITQRSADLSKKVLTQVQTLFVLRTTGPQDIHAIREWVKYYEGDQTLLKSLSSLENGEAWMWSPQLLKRVERFRSRLRRTFDSGATPKHGAVVGTARLAGVDLDKLRGSLATVIAQKEATDPAILRARIAELETKLAARPKAEPIVERVETIVALDRDLLELRAMLDGAHDLAKRIDATLAPARNASGRIVTAGHPDRPGQQKHDDLPTAIPISAHPSPAGAEKAPAAAPKPLPISAHSGSTLGKCERALLGVLAQRRGLTTTKAQLAILSGYSATSSGFANGIGALRSRGLAEGPGDALAITVAGASAAGPVRPMPKGMDLVRFWLGQLPKAERALLESLVAAHPRGLTKEHLSARTGYSMTSSGFANAIGRLRTLQLAERGEPIRASSVFFDGGR